MAHINKYPLNSIGYDFIPAELLPKGLDEYHLRYEQNPKPLNQFRTLTQQEIALLEQNGNISTNWNDVLVSESFLPNQIKNSKFYGLIRIGNMQEVYVEYRDLRLPSGIYNSQIISCDLGDTVAIHHVRYLAHFIVGDEVILTNINEMETSSNAKFGNGILKDGEQEKNRVFLELCNENGGRSVLPFDGMQSGDAFLWSRNRADKIFQERMLEMTDSQFSSKRGFYSTVGDRTAIKNSHIIKNVKIGSDAYIKGVNKLKNVTVNSTKEAYTQIGEGCEIVNGIIGFGCRIFYGVKAVRFVLSSFSQLKYGARLINSFLGDNSTISCCEVLNSLIYPAHEQHHNNSFLCASLVMGQSNMAAGATVGSNHNSRAADGEIVAGRGFWPGLCVSLKHNSRFTSYTLIVKGDFLHELDIRIPFSLVSNDVRNNRLLIVPAYWFLYNMYALMRNNNKFGLRDKRQLKNQYFEYNILAPDTINEMRIALSEIKNAVALLGEEMLDELLLSDAKPLSKEVLLDKVENSNRKVVLAKPKEAFHVFKKMIRFHAATQILDYLSNRTLSEFFDLLKREKFFCKNFINVGSQLIPEQDYLELISDVKSRKINSWKEVHSRYHQLSDIYLSEKLNHAIAALQEQSGVQTSEWDNSFLISLLDEALETKKWIASEIKRTRTKDYTCEFRKMVYDSEEEMNEVLGSLQDNSFITGQSEELEKFENRISSIKSTLR